MNYPRKKKKNHGRLLCGSKEGKPTITYMFEPDRISSNLIESDAQITDSSGVAQVVSLSLDLLDMLVSFHSFGFIPFHSFMSHTDPGVES